MHCSFCRVFSAVQVVRKLVCAYNNAHPSHHQWVCNGLVLTVTSAAELSVVLMPPFARPAETFRLVADMDIVGSRMPLALSLIFAFS